MRNEVVDLPRAALRKNLCESWLLWVLLIISLLWTIAIFVAPFTIPPGTVTNLEGTTRVDHPELWRTLPPFAGMIYFLGDAECHQIHSRTIYLNGNQMPVCARDTSIFLFITLGLLAGMMTRRNYYLSRGLISIFPERVRKIVGRSLGERFFAIVFVILCLAPAGIDGGVQLFTDYESTNLIRLLTGAPAGFISGLLIAVMVKSAKATKEYGEGFSHPADPNSTQS